MYFDLIIYYAILALIVLIGVIRFKTLTPPFRVLVVIILVILLSEISTRILAYSIRNSNPAYHILCILQYIGFALMYSKLLRGQSLKKAILISIIPFSVLSLLNTLFLQRFLTFPSNIIMLSYMVF